MKKLFFLILLAINISPVFAKTTSSLNNNLSAIEAFISKGDFDQDTIIQNREVLRKIKQESLLEKEKIAYETDILQKRLDALTKTDSDLLETKELTAQKNSLTDDYNFSRLKLNETELYLTRINELDNLLSVINRKILIGTITERGPIPIYPSIIIKSVPEFLRLIIKIIKAPIEWYTGISHLEKKVFVIDSLPIIFLILLSASLVWILNRMLLKKFCIRCNVQEPTYSRRLMVAFIEAAAKSLFFSTLIMGVYFWLSEWTNIMSPVLINLTKNLILWSLIVSLVVIFSKSFFVPPSPEWNLFSLAPEKLKSLRRIVNILVLVFAVQGFFITATTEFDSSSDLVVFGSALLGCIQAFLIISLMNARLWSNKHKIDDDEEYEDEDAKAIDAEGSEEDEDEDLLPIFRILIIFISLAGLGSYLIGYVAFGRFLISRLAFTGLSAIVFLLFHGLFLEMVRFVIFSNFLRKKLGVSFKGLKKIKFWLTLAIDPILIFLILLLVLPIWGVPRQDLMRWTVKALTGFSVGGVTISLIGIVSAMVVFVSVIFLSKFTRKKLVEKVLAETKLDVSVQHSLAAGVGYVGVIVAVALAVIVMGIDLTNLALIAGALSVGIGFGLQNVVNNFVSGIIILLERPIKVGDWVIVSDKEGLVKQINIRATEIETFQRASVIVPNADIVSNSLVNLTLKDRYGRIEIKVGVAYGSDVEKVKGILLKVARSNDRILKFPAPRVLFSDFGESSLDFELLCFTNNVLEKRAIASEMRFEINRLFNEEKIEIPFPQRVVHFATPLDMKKFKAEHIDILRDEA